MANLYPLYLNIKDKKCLVIGGGKVAQRKVESLIDCEADVVVVSPVLTSYLKEIVENNRIIYRKKEYSPEDLKDVFLVICATDSETVNAKAAEECMHRGILVNVIDDPEKCSALVPAVIRRGSMAISISTGGKSPYVSRKIREKLESQFGNEYERYLDILGDIRREALIKEPDPAKRKEMFRSLVDSDLLDLIRAGNNEGVKERIAQCISW